MISLKKRDIKKALKAGAKAGGLSLADVRADIENVVKSTARRQIETSLDLLSDNELKIIQGTIDGILKSVLSGFGLSISLVKNPKRRDVFSIVALCICAFFGLLMFGILLYYFISFLPKHLIEANSANTDMITAHGTNGNSDIVLPVPVVVTVCNASDTT